MRTERSEIQIVPILMVAISVWFFGCFGYHMIFNDYHQERANVSNYVIIEEDGKAKYAIAKTYMFLPWVKTGEYSDIIVPYELRKKYGKGNTYYWEVNDTIVPVEEIAKHYETPDPKITLLKTYE